MALSTPACTCDGQDMLTPCRGCPPAPVIVEREPAFWGDSPTLLQSPSWALVL